MGVSLFQWRAQIGLFEARRSRTFFNKSSAFKCVRNFFKNTDYLLVLFLLLFDFFNIDKVLQHIQAYTVFSLKSYFINIKIGFSSSLLMIEYWYLVFYWFLLILSHDIELNPGPSNSSWGNFSFCSWNLNGISVNEFCKITLLEAYNCEHKYDVICLSETFLDSSYSSEDPALTINGYKLMRCDHPNNIKRGGVAIYYKETLPIRFCNIAFLDECLVFELCIENRICFFVLLYRSPSQSSHEFDTFCSNLEKTLNHIVSFSPYLVFLVGDFNARSDSWWAKDINNIEGTQIEALTSSFGLHQLISEPTHILPNSLSCIDLVFINQPNLVLNCGVHPSLYQRCHHEIVYAIIDLKVDFPPPYERIVWDYSKAKKELINQCISQFDWDRAFLGKTIEQQVIFFNNTLINIFENFVPNKTIICDDKDPPWFNGIIKKNAVEK